MRKKHNITAELSEKWISDAFRALFLIKPYDKITIAEICRQAQLDRRTFYRHFASKDALLETWISQLFNELLTDLRDEAHLTSHTYLRRYFEFWYRHLVLLQAMQKDGLLFLLFEKSEPFVIRHRALLLAPELGRFAGDSTFAAYQGMFCNGAIFGVISKWLSEGASQTPEEMADIMLALCDPKKFSFPVGAEATS